jgi:glycosyltransferase 2 family protein
MIERPKTALPACLSLPSWQFWLGLVVSLACLGLALRDVDYSGVIEGLRKLNGWLLFLAILSVLATFLVKAFRWKMLFQPVNRPSVQKAFTIQSIGMLFNTFAPARLGDLARAYLMGESEETSKVYVLGTVVVEKFLDVIFLLFAMLLVLSQIVAPDWFPSGFRGSGSSAGRLAIGVLVGGIVFGLLIWKGAKVSGWVSRLFKFLPPTWVKWLDAQVNLGIRSLDVFRQPRQLAGLLCLSLVSWLLAASTNALVLAAMGLKLSIWASVLLLVVLQAGLSLPSSPGRIGVFHYLTLVTLMFLAVDRETALSSGVILHLVVIGPIGIVGAVCLWWEKITWNTLARATTQLRELFKRVK